MARAAYLMGAVGTSNVLAGRRYGIPVFGTMAHSYVQAHDDEAAAFEAFAGLYPGDDAASRHVRHARRRAEGHRAGTQARQRFRVRALRLDSGDLGDLARQARQLLDAAGLSEVRIFASGGLDEHELARLIEAGAPIDAFGVGTKLAVSEDAPSLDMAYKLVEYAGRPRMKLSTEKVNYPGRKQVFRSIEGGRMARDVIGRHDEALAGEPLLRPVMRGGMRLADGRVTLEEARAHARRELERLPETLRSLPPAAAPYRTDISPPLQSDLESLRHVLEASLS